MKKTASPPSLELPEGANESLEPRLLLLDAGNLRLLERGRELADTPAIDIGQPAIQKRIDNTLREAKSFDVQGLATSIANNSFLKHERLIVVNYDGERYLVLEGSRRLAAVRFLFERIGLQQLPSVVINSLKTLPCFVLTGAPVVDRSAGNRAAKLAAQRLEDYRNAAAIYIGLRHLMGSKSWEPASRYEFQAHLILDEGWSLQQVANRFGRKVPVVRRDLQAQVLYRDFLSWEKRSKRQHRITYNAFNEAVRARSIKDWLGWSDKENAISNKDREEVFFRYLGTRFPIVDDEQIEDEEEEVPSVEQALRHLKAMLDLHDPDIEESLDEGDFDSAETLYETRKEGKFAKRVKGYVRGLRNATAAELQENVAENDERLVELIDTAEGVRAQIAGFLNRRH